MSKRERVYAAYNKDALTADDAYSAVIHELYGPKATRWTLTAAQACHPHINAALKAKLTADETWLTVFRTEHGK